MSYVPINGLRLLAVETSILLVFFILAYMFLRFAGDRVSRPRWLDAVLAENWRSVALVIGLALVCRALLLPWVGVPQPRINDEYSYLMMGDTFAHLRLANPTPPARQHFETFHVNLTPTYHSKYPVSQGVALAAGELLFRQPWIGIYLGTAILCGAICWALQAFVPSGWALIGGILAVFRLALFSYWMNSYWGGSLAALGGALALGSAVRLVEEGRPSRERFWLSCGFGISLLILATSRPFEGFAFSLPLLGYVAYKVVRGVQQRQLDFRATAVPVIAIGCAGLAFMGFYNLRTTGDLRKMPYVLYERTYATIPLFIGQHVHRDEPAHDPVFAKYYEVEYAEHGLAQTGTLSGLIGFQVERASVNWFFFIGPALSIPALLGLLFCVKKRQLLLVLACAVTTAIAVGLCTFTQVHYYAPATVAVYVFVVEGLLYLWQHEGHGEHAFALAAILTVLVTCLSRQTATAAMNARFLMPDTRKLVTQQIAGKPGKQLVVVAYDMSRHYPGDELVHNGADFDAEKILWARSKGEGNDADLCTAFGDRTFWMVTTDDTSYSLQPLDLCHNR
jgi:hypothetical protein